ncbi:MAG: hypothetical protein RLZZ519_1807 [Bacteroidota bacterium]
MTTESKSKFTLKPEWIGAVIGGFGHAMLVTDDAGHITMVNEKACRLLGVNCDTVIGKPLTTLIAVVDSTSNRIVDLPVAQVLQLGLKISSEEGYAMTELPTGGRQVSFTMGRIRDEVGAVVGAVMSISCLANPDISTKAIRPDAQPFADGVAEPSVCNSQMESIFVRSNGRYVRILLTDLLWVEAMENYVQLQTTKEKFVVHTTLKNIAEALACKGFQRIHRSFIVKANAIESIEESHVMINSTPLPIGKSYQNELLGILTLL